MPAVSADQRLLLSRALRRLRLERGMSVREVAALLGIDFTVVSRIETGLRWPPSAEQLAAAFGEHVSAVRMPCPRCLYEPPEGFQCLRCGTASGDGLAETIARYMRKESRI